MAYDRRDGISQGLSSAPFTEIWTVGHLFTKLGRQPHDHLIVGSLVYDPTSLCLGVQSFHTGGYHAGGYGQRTSVEDANFTKMKSDTSTRCCAISDKFGFVSTSTQRPFAAAQLLLHAGSLARSPCVSEIICILKSSQAFFVELVVRNQLTTSL